MTLPLIDKQDNFELIGLKIAGILRAELNSQMALAQAAGKDPALWDLQIFSERSNRWENSRGEEQKPIVNIWFDNTNFDRSKSINFGRQLSTTSYNLDCYGFGVAKDTPAGHEPGDLAAALNLHRAIRLVRNILMSAEYVKLDSKGTVWDRWVRTITSYQPQLEETPANQVVAARIVLEVSFNEFSPELILEKLELLHVDVKRAENGEILLQADYPAT